MDERTMLARRVTWIGLVWNLALTAFKLAAGIIGHSGAMIADAVHSISDFITDIVVLAGFRFSGKPVDKSHDYGHGKLETLATAFIGFALLLVGGGLFWAGGSGILACIHGKVLSAPGGIAFVAAVLSIVVKEILYRYTVAAGRRINSTSVIANAWHHRSDAMSSVGTMFGIGGAIVLGEKWRVLDPVAAVIVSLFILKVSIEILSGCVRELVESSLDEGIEAEILRLALDVQGVADPHNLRTRSIGKDIAVDLHVRVDGGMSVNEAHDITVAIEDRIRGRFGKSSFVSIHIEPVKIGG